MAGLGISQLPLPPSAYRPDEFWSYIEPCTFESETDADREDILRIGHLELSARLATSPYNRQVAQNLADKLGYLFRREDPPASLASSAYMRLQRVRIVGALHQVVDEFPRLDDGTLDASTATVMRADWECTPGQLSAKSPNEFLNPLRMDLYRCGAGHATGAVVAGLHGEYEPQSNMLRIHTHLVAIRGMRGVVNQLRRLPAYAPIVRTIGQASKRVPAVRMQQIKGEELGRPLSYPFQAFWPSRWEGERGGKICRQQRKSRIPEPVHTQLLLWLDRWRLEDITMLVGLRVTRAGLQLTKAIA